MGQGNSQLTLFKCIARLSETDISIDDNDFWVDLLTSGIPVSYPDIAAMMPCNEIRRMRLYHPASLASLLYKCTEQIHCFAESKLNIGGTKYSTKESSFKPLKLPDVSGRPVPQEVSVHTATRCMHIIRRLMPTVMEKTLIKVPNEKTGYPLPAKIPQNSPDSPSINDEDISTYAAEFCYHVLENNLTLLGGTSVGASGASTTGVPSQPQAHKLPIEAPLSTLIANGVVAMGFIPNHTMSSRQKYTDDPPAGNFKDSGIVPSLQWSSGISRNPGVPGTKRPPVISQRRHIVKTLHALLSGQLYSKDAATPDNIFKNSLVDSQVCPLVPTLVCSLINAIVNYSPYGTIAFSSHVVGEEEMLVFETAQLLCLLFDTNPFFSEEGVSPANLEAQVFEKHSAWRVLLACGTKELKLVLGGLRNLIVNRSYAKVTRTPYSQRSLCRHDEFLILLFKMLDRCPTFAALLASEPEEFQPLVMPILDFALDVRRSPQTFSRSQLAMFILVRMCTCRQFVVYCNKPNVSPNSLEIQLSSGTITTNDLIVITLLTLISHREDPSGPLEQIPHAFLWSVLGYSIYKDDYEKPVKPLTPEKLSPAVLLHETCALIISNIMPYMTSICDATAMGLFSALRMSLNPSWIALHRSYPIVFQLLVESIASSIQYQQQAAKSIMYLLAVHDNLILTAFDCICRKGPEGEELPTQYDGFAPDIVYFTSDSLPVNVKKFGDLHARWSSANLARHIQKQLTPFRIPTTLPLETRKNLLLGTLAAASEAAATLLIGASLSSKGEGWEDATFVGTLPAPHQLLQRTLPSNKRFDSWMTTVLWGLIFSTTHELTDGRAIELFPLQTNHTTAPPTETTGAPTTPA